jgi:hypothetical protein
MAVIRTEQQFVKFMGSSPTKVANSGFTSEEFTSTRGKADPDMRLNPMPALGVVDAMNPNPRKASDRARLEQPESPEAGAAAEDNVRLTQFFVRSALKRARGKLNQFVRKGLAQRRGQLGDQRAKQMDASFSRLDKMAETLEFYDDLASGVLHRVLSHQKG